MSMFKVGTIYKQYKIVCLILWYSGTFEASQTNFNVKRFELCNSNSGVIKFNGSITKENNNQYFTFEIISPVPFDDQLGMTCAIQSKIGSRFMELFIIREKNYCKAANKYLGEFWYDIERAGGMIPGMCPIPAGRYNVRHLLLDFKKISLQTFPVGWLRFIVTLVDNKNTENNMLCWIMEVDNVPD